jgi:dTDP-glucose 4,6-dehydratase
MTKKNILVTGGCGFIGSHFVEKLINNPDIGCIVNFDKMTYAANRELEFHKDERYKHYIVDINDSVAVYNALKEHQITHVVHFAAESHVDNSIYSPDAFVETNVVGTFNLMKAAFDYDKLEKFIHISTDEVYGSLNTKESAFTVDSPYRPNSPYSATKAGSDLLVRSYYHTYKFPTIITNCSNNFGPRQHFEKLIPTCIRKLKNNESIPVYGNGSNIRDWIYVKDHVNCIWNVLENGDVGNQYLIGGNNEMTNLELIENIKIAYEEVTNTKVDYDYIQYVTDRKGHDLRYAIDMFDYEQKFGKLQYYNFTESLKQTIISYL